ncbi:dTMP kinase [Actinoplanes sp. NPDC051861]|uniref:dTMP kinase n=1 Tax=Actinoplanes sp. NPDC051861 TaxID=3155170 RepID=UPI0034401B2A
MTGRFIVVDGPSGAGKTTVVQLLGSRLAAAGENVVVTREPSDGPIGTMARTGTRDYHGNALACLVAADRYHHLDTTIRPALAAGRTVLSARYVVSSHVLQVADGVRPEMVWHLNAYTLQPDLTFILTGDPAQLRQRAADRGNYSRFHNGAVTDEISRYRYAADRLAAAGWTIVTIDIGQDGPDQVADTLLKAVQLHLPGHADAAERDTTSS